MRCCRFGVPNIDISPIADSLAVSNYVASYASKSEPRSTTYADIMHQVIENSVSTTDSVTKAIQKLLLKSVSEKNVPAQECCHLLMETDFYNSSRPFVTLTIRSDNWVPITSDRIDDQEEGEHSVSKSILQEYTKRHDDLLLLTLHETATEYIWSRTGWKKEGWRSRRGGKSFPHSYAVGREWGKLSPTLLPKHLCFDNALLPLRDEEHYRQQVILHVPWRNINHL